MNTLNTYYYNPTPQKRQHFPCSLNRAGKNKTWDYRKLNTKFEDRSATVADLMEWVRAGYALNGATFGGKRRNKSNVKGCGVWFADIDNASFNEGKEKVYAPKLTWEEAKEHPFIKKYCAFIYTSYSHTPDWHKFRLVVPLIEDVSADVYEGLFDWINDQFDEGTLDAARRDAGGIFFGSTRAEFWVNPDFEFIPPETLSAIARQRKEEREIRALEQSNNEWLVGIGDARKLAMVREALKFIPPRRRGTNTYDESIRVVMAVNSAFDDFTSEKLLEEWSPSDRSAGWVIPQKIRSLKTEYRGRRVSLGTLFHIARGYGYTLPDDVRGKNLHDWERACWEQWERGKTFTAIEEVDQRYLDIAPPEDGEFLFVCSPTATGKTTLLKKWCREEFEELGIIRFGYRNSLEMQFAHEAGFYHLRLDDDSEIMLKDDRCRVLSCVDSIHKYALSDFDGKVLVFDESDAVLRQAIFSMRTAGNLDRLKEALNRCSRAVFLSGTMADWVVNCFRDLAPKRIRRIKNIYQPDRPPTVWFTGAELNDLENPRRFPNDRTPLVREILTSDRPIMIQSDSKRCCDTLHKLLSRIGKRGIKLTSDTISEREAIAFMGNPDGYLSENRPDFVIASPTMESGNDIGISDYFGADFHFYFGVLGSDAIAQKLIRLRDVNCPRYIWCKEYVGGETPDSPLLDSLLSRFKRLTLSEVNLLFDGEEDGELIASTLLSRLGVVENSPFFRTAMLLKSLAQFERNNYRTCVELTLRRHGYALTDYSGDNDPSPTIKKNYKEATEEVITENARDIFNASDKYIDAPETALDADASYEDKCAIAKAKLIKRLPGIQKSEHWSEEFVKEVLFEQRNLITGLQRLWMCRHPEIAKDRAVSHLHRQNTAIVNGETPSYWNHRHEYLLCKTLIDIGLVTLIDTDTGINICGQPFKREFRHDSPEIEQLMKKCEAKKVATVIGKRPGKHVMKFFRFLVNLLGADLSLREIKLYDGSTEKRYSIVRSDNSPKGYTIAECFDRRFKVKPETRDWQLDKPVSEDLQNIFPFEEIETVEKGTDVDLREMAKLLNQCEERSGFFELLTLFRNSGYTRRQLNYAFRKLPLKRQEILKSWILGTSN